VNPERAAKPDAAPQILPDANAHGLKGQALEGEGGPDDNSRGDQSFQDRTLVDEPVDSPSKTSHERPHGATDSISPAAHTASATADGAGTMHGAEPWDITRWDPAQTAGVQRDTSLTSVEQTFVNERGAGRDDDDDDEDVTKKGDVLILKGLAAPAGEDDPRDGALSKVSTRSPRRPSALQLKLKPPSPQPWDLVPPPREHMQPPPLSAGLAPSPSASARFAQATADVDDLRDRHDMACSGGRTLVPKSSYYFGPPASDSAYGTPPVGQIGVHHPREIVRVERDYSGGEVIQFAPIYPLELENRITPTQFLESINTINEVLISAHSLRRAFYDNLITIMSLQLSRLFLSTHLQKELKRLRAVIDDLNVMLYNPVGLNILWPGDVAFLFLEVEYY